MSTTAYPYPWPIGTCHFNQLPIGIQESFNIHIVDGIIEDGYPVHRTATEGPYVSFAGWKVRVMIENTSPTTYIVRIV